MSFEPSSESMQTKCDDVLIIDDTDIEPDEQFSVQLTVVVPVGNFGVNETCITIIDDDREFACVSAVHSNSNLFCQ